MRLRPALPARALLAAAALASASALAQADQASPSPAGIAGQDFPSGGPSSQAFSDPSQLFSGKPGAFFGIGLGKIGGDVYASTTVNTDFNLGPIGLGLQLPLNLLVVNDEKSDCPIGKATCTRDDKTYFSVLRRKDWDEASDFVKFIRYVRYGRKRDPFFIQAGQLWGASIGHGTIMNRYSNSLSLDHPKAGLQLDVNTTYFGFETVLDSFASRTVFGGRAYVRPFGETLVLRGLAAGVSVLTDRVAPLDIRRTATGAYQVDAQGNIAFEATRPFYAFGIDVEYEVLRNSLISLIPYIDANRLAGAGNGLHAGILTTIALPIPILEVGLQARLEYRVMQAGYIPEYFNQTYDLGRVQYATGAKDAAGKEIFTTKLRAAEAAHLKGGDARQGYYGELAFNFAGLLQIGGVYQDYQGDPGASLGLFATFPKIEIVKASAYYLRNNFKGFDQAFTIDQNSLLGASLAYRVFGPLYIRGEFQRRWVLTQVTDATGTVTDNKLDAVNTYNFGIASYLAF